MSVFIVLSGSSAKSDNDNSIDTNLSTSELITPEHTITKVGSTITLSCVPNIVSSNIADDYKWILLHKPANSKTSLIGKISSSVLTIDKEGYYVIELALYKKNVKIGTNYSYIGTPSVVHYVRSSAKGKNTGSDWMNAWNKLPVSLVRGHTYYMADGVYPPYYCNTPQEDVKPIYIKKAINDDHGTDAGWDKGSMGNGQAIFKANDSDKSSPFILNSNYVVIDGQRGEKNDKAGKHGFKFLNQTRGTVENHGFMVGNKQGISANVHQIKIKHCEIQAATGRGFQVHSMVQSNKNLLLHSCYIHDIIGISIYFVNTSNSIVEYCYVARNHSDPVGHGEGIQTNGTDIRNKPACLSNIIRYNTWEDIEGTAVIVGDKGWKVYGNLAFYTQKYINSDPQGRHKAGIKCNNFVGMGFYTTTAGGSRPDNKIFNNTIIGGYSKYTNGPNMGVSLTGSNNIIYNNLWANCARLPAMGRVHDYNMYFNNNINNKHLEPVKETHVQYVKSDPFVKSASNDFRLRNDTDSGIELDSEYSYDMDGKKRGVKGKWTRGAFQFED